MHFYSDYWGYFQPIYEYMPKNCSSDVVAVIELDIHLLYHVLLTVFRDGGRIPYVIPYVWLPLRFFVN